MNIFYLSPDPKVCAEMHLDKHVTKMIIEYGQLMSTAHRVLDGQEYIDKTANGRSIKRWRLNGELENSLMKASHINHPSGVWTRTSHENYNWLYRMWYYLCKEYTYRYGKIHSVETRLLNPLYLPPERIPLGAFFPPTPAMPDDCKVPNDSLASYHKYYIERKNHFAKWTKREIPIWYSQGLKINNANL
jgi:hypothetical protein